MAKKRLIAAGLLSALALVAVAGCVPADMYGDYPSFGYQPPVMNNYWYSPPPVYYNRYYVANRPYGSYYWNRYNRAPGYGYAPRNRYGHYYNGRQGNHRFGPQRNWNNRSFRRSGGPNVTRRWGGNHGTGGPRFNRGGGHQPRNFSQGGGHNGGHNGGHGGPGGGSSSNWQRNR
jgi:hypothetical protein